jgi:hypothetical protein
MNEEELAAYERRLRRRRYTILDEFGESDEEVNGNEQEEEYIDFRTYPLNISWKDLYSFKTDSCK